MANECIPLYEPGAAITAEAVGAVVGKRFVRITGKEAGTNLVNPPGSSVDQTSGGNVLADQAIPAGKLPFGVADKDAAIGQKFGILRGGVVPMEAGTGGVTAGQELQSDVDGRPIALTTGASVGFALSIAAAGAEVMVALRGLS
jgi:hypothetical protein